MSEQHFPRLTLLFGTGGFLCQARCRKCKENHGCDEHNPDVHHQLSTPVHKRPPEHGLQLSIPHQTNENGYLVFTFVLPQPDKGCNLF